MRPHDSQKFPGLSIFHRLLLAFIGISLFVISVMGTVYYFYAKERVSKYENNEIQHLLDSTLGYFNNNYNITTSSDLTLLEASPSLDNLLTVPRPEMALVRFDIEKMFFRLAKSHQGFYRAIIFFDAYGHEKIAIKDGKRTRRYTSISEYQKQKDPLELGIASLFHNLKKASPGSILFEGPFADENNNQSFLVGISKREPEIAGFGGVIMFRCDLANFINYVSNIKLFDRSVAWIFTAEDKLIYSPDGETELPFRFSQKDTENKISVSGYPIHAHDRYVHCDGCFLGSDNKPLFHIAITIPPDIFTRLMKEIVVRAFIIIALVFSFAGVISYFLAKQFARPIVNLSRASRLFSKGELTGTPVAEGGGEIGELSRSFYDMAGAVRKLIKNRDMEISSRIKVEELLRKAHEELERRVEERTYELKITHEQLLHAEKLSAIGGLSASFAHEFNNPLQGVLTVIKGLKRRYSSLDEEDVKLVEMAIGECNRMKDLIKSLQDFNRPSSGRVTPIDIHAMIESLLLLSKKDHNIKKIKVEKNFSGELPHIRAVADQIKQVLLNLLNNAADACDGGGEITISTEADTDNVYIKIQDTGKGIKPEDKDRIFDPFFTTKPEIKGTGLGLSISYGIIKKHGGRIEFESEPEQGAIFTVILPIKGTDNG